MKLAANFIAALLLAGSAHAAPAQPHPSNVPDAAAALHAIEGEIDRDALESSFQAQFRAGKPVTGFMDFSLDKVRRDVAARTRRKAALDRIDPARLSAVDRQTWQILQFDFATAPDEAEYWLTFDLTPYQAPLNMTTVHQAMAAQALTTPAEVANYVRLLGEYARMLDTLAAKIDAQRRRGIYMPKAVLPLVRATWTRLAAGAFDLRPPAPRLAKLANAERARLSAEFDRVLAARIAPAYERINTLIGADYEVKAPTAVGISHYPRGNQVYLRQVQRYTTTRVTPEALHQQGLAAVADMIAKMQAIRTQLGFAGSSRAFYDKLSADPRFLARTTADVEATYWRYIRAMEPKVPIYFRTVPKAPYGVQRLPLAAEPGQTFGYYSPPNAGEARGLYHYNGSNLEKRSLIHAGTLIYHELIPGHHFQIALQDESTTLTPFRKRYLAGAFIEGWAEYAASLGIELKLYDTPEALYGRYVSEINKAVRLVADTGVNYLGWSLEKTRSYMHEVTSLSDVEIDSESLRYATSIPAQALSYRTGYDEFWRLRHRAEAALGAKFDVRDFHEVILSSGARPMSVVEADIDAYITAKRSHEESVTAGPSRPHRP